MGKKRQAVIDGVEYPSVACAARKLKVTYGVAQRWASKGTTQTTKRTGRPKPITVKDKHYPSHLAAAKDIGVTPQEFNNWLCVAKLLGEMQ